MTWEQFVGWMRYYAQEPFGEERADIRAAITDSVIANANRDSKKRPRPFSPQDFMPFAKSTSRSGRTKPLTDQAEFRRMTQNMMAAFGPTPKRDPDINNPRGNS